MFVGQLAFANQCVPIAHPGRFNVDQQLPGGWFRPRQVNVCDGTRWTELKYSGCFHLSSSKIRLTRDQYRINGLFLFERACRTVGGATASGSLAWNFQSTGYSGIVNSNQQLVVCDSSFNVSTRPCSWIRISFMGALSPLSAFEGWCTFRFIHR